MVAPVQSLLYYPTMHRYRLAACAALAVLALSGCISTEMELDLNNDGSGSIVLAYEFDEALYDMGVFDGSDVARPIPVTRDEFEEAALVTGMRLRSYRIRNNDGTITVTARLRFESADQLVRLLGPGQLEFETTSDNGSFRYLLARAVDADLTGAELAADLEGYSITLVVDPPASVGQTNGEVLDNGTVRFTISLAELASTSNEVLWEIAW